ncbi:DNA/RNA non-specific endonuclease [Tropicibacter sp. R16_0]|uniref:DNA/RNA non-specific endonuclease n=1 Tax=Tropicibacter sp. R16_0 TaxID=2821102 RepID=UPI001ADB5B91|nr:DNA/RNA non-specific endonuclease [Tropicibacter sp. R16_0]MBO9449926.1 DNA/RNA non-specific endonuclease [Tropicibacter sp. R16_0]
MTTPRDRINRLRTMLSTDDLVQMRDAPEAFAADPDATPDVTEGLVPQPLLRMGATPKGEPDGGMVRLAEVMQKFENEDELSLEDAMIAEAIIVPLKRPAVLVKNDDFQVKHQDWLHLNDAGLPAQGHILSAIPSVGRINVPSDWSVPYAGTGFVVGENLLMTNRHVAEVFANGLGQTDVALKPGASVNINFKAEHGSFKRRKVRIEGVRMIHPYWDMALLEVGGFPEGVQPLQLSQAAPATLLGKEVAVLGYPAFDPRNDTVVQHELFKRIYNVKRLQPGIYTRQGVVRSFDNRVRASCHDASTLGGNSGSVVVGLESGLVVGLHFGGIYRRENYAVPASELARDPYVVKAGVQFAPAASVPEGNPWRTHWAATEGTEQPAPQTPETGGAASPAAASTTLRVTTTTGPDGAELALNVPVKMTLGFNLDDAKGSGMDSGGKAPAEPLTEKMVEPRHDGDYSTRMGYDRAFLGLHVAMPVATNDDDLSRQADGDTELRYHNFSLIMNAKRRLAQITASGVDASEEAKEPEPGFTYTRRELNGFTSKNDREKWFLDPRIPAGDQLPDKFYNQDRTAFDKGHLVRRDAVTFGTTFEEVQMANGDTFHSTNCSPQVKGFNRSGLGGIWGKLENDVLEAAATNRCVVFSGPVFANDDRDFHGRDLSGDTVVQIPAKYWKMIVTREGDALRTHAYVLEQDLSEVAFKEFAKAGDWVHHEVAPAELEQMLGNVTFPHLVSGSDKMSAKEWRELVSDPDTTDEEIMELSIILPGAGAFDFRIVPNPDLVHLPPGAAETENAMAVANDLARSRRAASFNLRTVLGNSDPVLVSEMDSWGQFPVLIKEIVDHLNKDYRVWSVGAAGDTAQNMVLGPVEPRKTEYMLALNEKRADVKGFVFSAAGNDMIGEDPNTGKPVLTDLIRDFNGNPLDVQGHINHTLLEDRLDFLRGVYRKVITDIRSDPDFSKLPIFIHGYDYPFPYPWVNDHRNPAYAAKDRWLGKPFSDRSIHDKTLRRDILKVFIDRLYDMLGEFSGNSKTTKVWLVDCRNTMPNLTDWADEIHGTSSGFRKVTQRFKVALREAKV